MKVTVLKKHSKNDTSIVISIVLLILGLFLTFDSNGMMDIVFTVLGGIIIAYGIYKLIVYSNLIKEHKKENSSLLLSTVAYITFGIIIILLSNILTNAVNIITGIWLIYTGIDKIIHQRIITNGLSTPLITGIILIIIGIYSIISQNAVFVFIGIALIIYSLTEILNYLKNRTP